MTRVNLFESDKAYEGLDDKAALIRRYYEESLRYPEVRAFAEEASVGDSGRPAIETLFVRLKSHVKYIPDPVGVELIKAPWVQVEEIAARGWTGGDCDDFSSLSYALLHLLGVPAKLAVAWYGGNLNPTHIWTVAPLSGGAFVPFDLCAAVLGQTKEGAGRIRVYE